jgi:DNA-binding transcriptional regulator YdaS (Cro superfamily)
MAIEAAGTMTELGKRIGLSPQAIAKWRRVPAERCLDVEHATGISRHDLRPDIYGPAPRRARGNALAGAAA